LTVQGNYALASLAGLPEELPALRTLELRAAITDLSGLPRMPKLAALYLTETQVGDIEGLDQKCPNLVSLDIRGTGVKSLKGLPASVRVLYAGDQVSD
jgi:hypothetical protein